MSLIVSRCAGAILSRRSIASSRSMMPESHAVPWFTSVMTIKTSAPLSAEPKKKKKVDPRREMQLKERLKKKLKRLEKVPPELIPIEDFVTPSKCLDETRERSAFRLPFEESERRALLLKTWCQYKQNQHKAEVKAVELALEAQREALEELKMISEELYLAALTPDPSLFPLTRQGPVYTPPKPTHDAPDGKYIDVTKVYEQ